MPKLVDKQQRRQQILRAASHVFADQGYHHTRMDDVARECGCSKGLIYEYYASKDELFLDVCQQLVPWNHLDLSSISLDAQGATRLVTEIAQCYDQSKDFFLILSDFWSNTSRGEVARRKKFIQRGTQFYKEPRSILGGYIERGQKFGTFNNHVDAGSLASVVIAGIEGIRLQDRIDKKVNKHAALATLAKMFVNELMSEDSVKERPVGK